MSRAAAGSTVRIPDRLPVAQLLPENKKGRKECISFPVLRSFVIFEVLMFSRQHIDNIWCLVSDFQ